ncbi:MAG TPA: RHS repeat-associated core domain-containing protein [Opitutaceae bacterium]|nr:RHS repeat-associated core domain-containing protein [Opitutaceae bacterium]
MSRPAFRLLLGCLALAAASTTFAVTPNPFTVPVSFTERLWGVGNGIMTVYAEPGDAVEVYTLSGGNEESALRTAWLRPGKKYTVNLQASNPYRYDLSFVAPDGYEIYIDGFRQDLLTRTGLSGWYSHDYTVEVQPVAESAALAFGGFSGIGLGKSVNWTVGLGGLRTGRSAGRVVFREFDLSADPTSRARLYYSAPENSDQIAVYRDGPSNQTLRQIMAPQGLVDFYDETSGGYSIRFYSWSDATWDSGLNLWTFTGSPWRSIRVESPAAHQLRITETEGAVSRVSLLRLTSQIPPSGGEITIGGGYTIHRFTQSGTFTAPMSLTADVVVVAGGGGGATQHAGGGGAGGVVQVNGLAVSTGAHAITVGAGGLGNTGYNAFGTGYSGQSGGNSSAFSQTAIGGGHGASNSAGGAGGSGGGSGYPDPTLGGAGTSGQGYSGNISYTGGAFNGGGAGSANGGHAAANTGSGGGGGGNLEGKGGNGGSGIVVLRYATQSSAGVATGTYEWTLQEGDGSTWERTEVRTSTRYSGYREELLKVYTGNTTGELVTDEKYRFEDQGWGEELVTATAIPATGTELVTSYTYHTNAANRGNYRRVKSVSLPTGSWSATEYYDDWDRRGRLKYAFAPFGDLPATAAGASLASGQVTYLEYGADWTGRFTRPTLKEISVNGAVTARTVWINGDVTGAGAPRESVTTRVYSSNANYETGSGQYYRGDAGPDYVGQPYFSKSADGRHTSASMTRGSFDEGTRVFAVDPAAYYWRELVFHGTETTAGAVQVSSHDGQSTDPVYLVPEKSTMSVTIRNSPGNVVRTETHVFTGSGFAKVSHQDYYHDSAGRLTSTLDSNGLATSRTYVGGRLFSAVGVDGTETQFPTYDGLGRVKTSVKKGAPSVAPHIPQTGVTYPAQEDITTTFVYDGAGRITQEDVAGGSGAAAAAVSTKREFDRAGRLKTETANFGSAHALTTSHAYLSGGRIVTTTFPGGATRTTETHLDGRVRQVTGDAQVSDYSTYTIEAGTGRLFHQRNPNHNANNWINCFYDWAGRKVEEWIPAWNGGSAGRTWHYNSKGQLWKATEPGRAATIFEYDPALGTLVREGLDVGGNDGLDPASSDRITEHAWTFFISGSAWWRRETTSTYATLGNPTAKQVAKVETQLSGLPTGRLSLANGTDIYGNITSKYVDVFPATKKVVATTDYPDASTNGVSVVYNGLEVQSRDKIGVIRRTEHDGLGRPTKAIHPRHGSRTTAYLSGTGLVGTVSHSLHGVQHVYSYDSAGRIRSHENAVGMLTYSAYTSRGELFRQWGNAAYPAEYEYDGWGRRTKMKTFRGGAGWDQTDWPGTGANVGNSTGTPDVTTWNFDTPTGFLTSKVDATNQGVTYTYTPAGQLLTRTWARGVVTTYGYSPLTGELTSVDYSDTTPDLTYTYNRLGRQDTVTDVAGQRQLVYNLGGTFELQREQLPAYLDSRWLTYEYDTVAGALGRPKAFKLGNASNAAANHTATYGYSTASGQLSTITLSEPGFPSGTYTYNYELNSHLIRTIVRGSSIDERIYSSGTDRLLSREYRVGTTNLVRFTYQSRNDLGQALQTTKTGSLFTRYGNSLRTDHTYNSRAELATESSFLSGPPTVALVGRDDAYTYDNIGNRASLTHNGSTSSYVTNSLNQYSDRNGLDVLDVSGSSTSGSSIPVHVAGATATQQGASYFFQTFKVASTSAPRFELLDVGVSPASKSVNGVISFNWNGKGITTPTTTLPTGATGAVIELNDDPDHAGIDSWHHGYTFAAGKTYTFGFWARTLAGMRDINPALTEDVNSGFTAETHTIDTNWRWITVTKTYAAVGGNPRAHYCHSIAGDDFQVYGAAIYENSASTYSLHTAYVPAKDTVFAYDLDGNLKNDGRFVYDYDAENRMISAITTPAAVAAGHPIVEVYSYYDYLGRRIRKVDSKAGVTTERRFLWSGWNIVAEYWGPFNANAFVSTNNRQMFWGPDLSGTFAGAGGVGGLLMVRQSGVAYNPAYDQAGNIHAMLNGTQISAAYEYDAFGNTLRESGTYAASNPFRFATKYTDIETGLVQYNTRYYSPSLGRFINRDTIGEAGGLNLYAYVSNRVPNAYDYLGMDEVEYDVVEFNPGNTVYSGFGPGGTSEAVPNLSTRRVRVTTTGPTITMNPFFVNSNASPSHDGIAAYEMEAYGRAVNHAGETGEIRFMSPSDVLAQTVIDRTATPEHVGGPVEAFGPMNEKPITMAPFTVRAGRLAAEFGPEVIGAFFEPLDWALTAREIYRDPTNPWSYAGFIPFVPTGVGKLGKLAQNVAEAAPPKTTTLYRAVSPAEFADAVGNQVLRPGPNSYATGKFFAENADHAAQWGNLLEGPGNFRIIQVDFNAAAANQFMRWERLDGIGPARFGTFDQMQPLFISPFDPR